MCQCLLTRWRVRKLAKRSDDRVSRMHFLLATGRVVVDPRYHTKIEEQLEHIHELREGLGDRPLWLQIEQATQYDTRVSDTLRCIDEARLSWVNITWLRCGSAAPCHAKTIQAKIMQTTPDKTTIRSNIPPSSFHLNWKVFSFRHRISIIFIQYPRAWRVRPGDVLDDLLNCPLLYAIALAELYLLALPFTFVLYVMLTSYLTVLGFLMVR